MKDVVASVPHSGTRTLVEHLGLGDNSPRGRWLHFDYDEARLHKGLHLHIPLRNPMDVAASWASRGKNIDKLIRAYESMFAHLHMTHTIHRMEDIPALAGTDDHDRKTNGTSQVSAYQDRITSDIVLPNLEFFERYYNGAIQNHQVRQTVS